MDTYKQNIKLIRERLSNVESHVRNDQMRQARETLLKLVKACFDLSVDLHSLEIRSRFAKLYPLRTLTPEKADLPEKVVTPAKKRTRRTWLSDKDKELIRTMTAEGSSMRDIAKKLDCTPSIVWRWQKKLGVKKGSR